jgi:hypothetical protein
VEAVKMHAVLLWVFGSISDLPGGLSLYGIYPISEVLAADTSGNKVYSAHPKGHQDHP